MSWTVLVYMAADTSDSFYRYAMEDIGEMMQAQFGPDVKVFVHADAPSPWHRQCWEVTGASKDKEAKTSRPKIGKAEPVTCDHGGFLDFVKQHVQNDESEYYLIVFWGHGEGIDWKEKALKQLAPGPSIQAATKRFAPGSQSAIEVGDLGEALAGLKLTNAGDRDITSDNVVVGFDACLMGMVEVYYEIQKHARWGVATNDEIPDTGWPYQNILQVLGCYPDIGPEELAEKIVEISTEWYSQNDPDTKISFAACDLSKSLPLRQATKELTSKLSECINTPAVWQAVKKARDFADDFQEVAYVDIHSFCSELTRQTEEEDADPALKQLREPVSAVSKALADFVICHNFSDSYPTKYSKDAFALSICFPESPRLVGSVANLTVDWRSYIDLTFSQQTKWPCFLTRFWDAQRGDRRKASLLAKAAGC
jgi:Clostripain family